MLLFAALVKPILHLTNQMGDERNRKQLVDVELRPSGQGIRALLLSSAMHDILSCSAFYKNSQSGAYLYNL